MTNEETNIKKQNVNNDDDNFNKPWWKTKWFIGLLTVIIMAGTPFSALIKGCWDKRCRRES